MPNRRTVQGGRQAVNEPTNGQAADERYCAVFHGVPRPGSMFHGVPRSGPMFHARGRCSTPEGVHPTNGIKFRPGSGPGFGRRGPRMGDGAAKAGPLGSSTTRSSASITVPRSDILHRLSFAPGFPDLTRHPSACFNSKVTDPSRLMALLTEFIEAAYDDTALPPLALTGDETRDAHILEVRAAYLDLQLLIRSLVYDATSITIPGAVNRLYAIGFRTGAA